MMLRGCTTHGREMTEHLPGVLICVKDKTKMGWLMKLVVGPNHTPTRAAYSETGSD